MSEIQQSPPAAMATQDADATQDANAEDDPTCDPVDEAPPIPTLPPTNPVAPSLNSNALLQAMHPQEGNDVCDSGDGTASKPPPGSKLKKKRSRKNPNKCAVRGCTFEDMELSKTKCFSCDKLVHDECALNLLDNSKSVTNVPTDKFFCSIGCYKSYVAENSTTAGNTWTTDGPEGKGDGQHSEYWLIEWLSDVENYDTYRGSDNGTTKLEISANVAAFLNGKGVKVFRNAKQVQNKIMHIEKLMRDAHDWENSETGAGVLENRGEESFKDTITKKCSFYFYLKDVFISRASIKPKITSAEIGGTDLTAGPFYESANDHEAEYDDFGVVLGQESDELEEEEEDQVEEGAGKTVGLDGVEIMDEGDAEEAAGEETRGLFGSDDDDDSASGDMETPKAASKRPKTTSSKRKSTKGAAMLRSRAMAKNNKGKKGKRGKPSRSHKPRSLESDDMDASIAAYMRFKMAEVNNPAAKLAEESRNFKEVATNLGSRVQAAKLLSSFRKFLTDEELAELDD